MIRQSEGGHLQYFEWDVLGRLVRSKNDKAETYYRYDALARRIKKQHHMPQWDERGKAKLCFARSARRSEVERAKTKIMPCYGHINYSPEHFQDEYNRVIV